jgi:hypothetical protein
MSFAVACMAGSFKGAFVHGALCGLEERGVRADAYGAASSSVLPAAYAASGRVRQMGMALWSEMAQDSMSATVLHTIRTVGPGAKAGLFAAGAARFVVAVSRVKTPEAAAETQGDGARRRGRRLLLEMARKDTAWRDAHLAAELFDTAGPLRLTEENFDEVAYATTRMLHAWHVPASVGGTPYVDASYTCQCPAMELAELGFTQVLAIATEPGPLWRDLYANQAIGAGIAVIQPSRDLKDLGVDFTSASKDGLQAAFEEGFRSALRFVDEGIQVG